MTIIFVVAVTIPRKPRIFSLPKITRYTVIILAVCAVRDLPPLGSGVGGGDITAFPPAYLHTHTVNIGYFICYTRA